MATLKELTIKLKADATELETNINKADRVLGKFSAKNKKMANDVSTGTSQIKGVFKDMGSQITGALGTASGSLGMFASSMSTAFGGVNLLTGGMTKLKIALISTGIGAILILLASLFTYFTQSQDGANNLSIAMSGLKAVFSVIIDTLSALGGGLVDLFVNPMENLKSFGAAINTFMIERFNLVLRGIQGMSVAFDLLMQREFKLAGMVAKQALKDIVLGATPVGWAMELVARGVEKVIEKFGEASDEAKQAMALQQDAINLETRRIALKLTNSEKEIALSKLLRDQEDVENFTLQQRLNFNKQALALQQEISKSKISYVNEELRIKQALDNLANNMQSDDEATVDLLIKKNELLAAENNSAIALITKGIEINNGLKSQVAEQEKIKRIQEDNLRLAKEKADLLLIESQSPELFFNSTDAQNMMDDVIKDLEKNIEPIEILVEPKVDTTENFEELTADAIAVANLIQSTINDAFVGIGESLGEALAGTGSGIKGILDGLLMMMIDFGANFGKILIAQGIATVAAKSLISNPASAIIGGIALVAITGAMKNLMKKGPAFANGGIVGGSSFSGDNVMARVNSSEMILNRGQQARLFSMANGVGGSSSQNINLSGMFRISGQDLVLALNETTRRNQNNY